MNIRALSAAGVCLSLLLPAAALARNKHEDIYNPTIPLSTKASMSHIKKGVKMSVLNRRWTISDESGNSFEASYTKNDRRGNMTARIRVTYSKQDVKIRYVRSENMDADGSTINRAYNSWVKNLEKDIPIYVEREAIRAE